MGLKDRPPPASGPVIASSASPGPGGPTSWLAGEPALVRAFEQDEDIHRAVAAEVFGVPLDQVTSDQRRYAKVINFGIVYGVSAMGLARRIEGMTVRGAGDLIAALFLFHLLRTDSVAEALSRSASSVFGVLKRTADASAREMQLIEAQEEIVQPSRMFWAEQI